MVKVRFFAAARAAVGASTASVPAGTLESVLAAFEFPVIAKCSFLVNGVAEADRSRGLVEGDTVDVLPPFAGG
ncbi:MAG TPA: MoaD/ThiS family protein [Galbitalea sp.]|nr:MoaD/ThiS family protein [Galbitalea sp.]